MWIGIILLKHTLPVELSDKRKAFSQEVIDVLLVVLSSLSFIMLCTGAICHTQMHDS